MTSDDFMKLLNEINVISTEHGLDDELRISLIETVVEYYKMITVSDENETQEKYIAGISSLKNMNGLIHLALD